MFCAPRWFHWGDHILRKQRPDTPTPNDASEKCNEIRTANFTASPISPNDGNFDVGVNLLNRVFELLHLT